MIKVLPDKKAPNEVFRAEILRTFLCNAPATMEYAVQYGLCPGEVRTIFYEALLHAIGNMRTPGPNLPIMAKPPADLCCKTPIELQFLLGDYSTYARTNDC